MSKILQIILLILCPIWAWCQIPTPHELAKKFIAILQTGNTEALKPIQATAEVYRVIASTQMKGKTNEQIMSIVNNPAHSLSTKTQEIFTTLLDYSLLPPKLSLNYTTAKPISNQSSQFNILTLFLDYEGTPDTLVLEIFDLRGDWKLVNIAQSDDQLAHIIAKKGQPNAAYFRKLAVQSQKAGQYNQAIQWLDKAVACAPKDPESYYLRGYNYIELRNMQAAKADILKAIELKPDYAAAYLELGYVLRETGDINAAIEAFKKTIQLDPSRYYAYLYLGEIYDKKKEDTLSIQYYTKADEISNGAYFSPVFKIALLKSRQEKFADAATFYSLAAKRAPEIFEVFFFKGLNESNMEQYADALKSFDQAVKLSPSSTDAVYERGVAKMKLGDFAGALADFDKSTTINPRYTTDQMFVYRGICYLKLGQKQKACAEFHRGVERGQEGAEEMLKMNCP